VRQNRFYWAKKISGPNFELDEPTLVNQLKNVLRLEAGDQIILFDGQGSEVLAKLIGFSKNSVALSVVAREEKEEKGPAVCLYLAILKKENFELAVQKAVEAGVSRIVPIITERTIKLGLKTDRLRLIIKEATEQSGRLILPELGETLNFAKAVEQAGAYGGLNIFCDLGVDSSLVKTKVPPDILASSELINLFIGPEGGWGVNEQEIAKLANFVFCSLGAYTLRAETAVTVATWLAVNKKF